MLLRRSLSSIVVAGSMLFGAATLPPAAAADPIIDPIIGALAALPTPYQPYEGDICRSGKPKCIKRVIKEMKQRLAPLAESCSHDAIFSLAYLRVTENVAHAAGEGYFSDRRWLTRLDAVFANMYFDTMDAWTAGDTASVPKAWRIALKATRDETMTGLGNFLLNMNAHINNDFPYALAEVGLTAKNGTSHKADHDAYNERLDALYKPVFAEEAARFDPTFDDYDVGTLDDSFVGGVIRGWREVVWRNAEALVNAPDAQTRRLVQQEITSYSTGQAELLKGFFNADPSKRNAYCAAQR